MFSTKRRKQNRIDTKNETTNHLVKHICKLKDPQFSCNKHQETPKLLSTHHSWKKNKTSTPKESVTCRHSYSGRRYLPLKTNMKPETRAPFKKGETSTETNNLLDLKMKDWQFKKNTYLQFTLKKLDPSCRSTLTIKNGIPRHHQNKKQGMDSRKKKRSELVHPTTKWPIIYTVGFPGIIIKTPYYKWSDGPLPYICNWFLKGPTVTCCPLRGVWLFPKKLQGLVHRQAPLLEAPPKSPKRTHWEIVHVYIGSFYMIFTYMFI